MGEHTHTCATCQHKWRCVEPKCGVENAAKVNGTGPFCLLCQSVEMARRAATLRGWKLSVRIRK
jgi:hypothetical protein